MAGSYVLHACAATSIRIAMPVRHVTCEFRTASNWSFPKWPNGLTYIMSGCSLTTAPVTKTMRLAEWVTPGDTALPGMTSLKDGNLRHSSALAQSPNGDIEPQTYRQTIIRIQDSQYRTRLEKRRSLPVVLWYRVDQSQTETMHDRFVIHNHPQ